MVMYEYCISSRRVAVPLAETISVQAQFFPQGKDALL